MEQDQDYHAILVGSINQIGQRNWDACANPDGGVPFDPFTTYRFLSALEESQSVGQGAGWIPQHLAIKRGKEIIAVMPCYAKTHSQGEYIFDHNFAQAYEGAGGAYYPKLQAAVPFTPVTGRRILTRTDNQNIAQNLLIKGAQSVVKQQGWSSFHITFCTKAEYNNTKDTLLQRIYQQYHWYNQSYADFDAFLAQLSARKRKNIRKERARARGFGGTIECLQGDAIKPHHLDAIWDFYQDTGARKWGRPYLTRAFFEIAYDRLRDDIVLFLAKNDGRYVAGAMNFIGRDAIFGRYWGCVEYHDAMHFELCYYRAIDYAIKHALLRVEAGAQGDHKLARGYLPAAVYALHWFENADFGDAVEHYLSAERNAISEEIEVLNSCGPFKKEAIYDD